MASEAPWRWAGERVWVWVCVCVWMLSAMEGHGKDHIVGANRGWQVPADAGPDAHLNYTIWASQQTFLLMDELTFNYQKNAYTVFEVNYSTYVNCSFSMWYGNDWLYNYTNRGGKTKLVLNETRPYYFACGMGDHCRQGMKFGINVTAANTSSNSSEKSAPKSSDESGAASSIAALVSTLLGTQSLILLLVCLLYPSI